MEYSCEHQNTWFLSYRHAPKMSRKWHTRGLVRPILEYVSPDWDPHGIVVQEEVEKVQNRAVRFVTGNYNFELEV